MWDFLPNKKILSNSGDIRFFLSLTISIPAPFRPLDLPINSSDDKMGSKTRAGPGISKLKTGFF